MQQATKTVAEVDVTTNVNNTLDFTAVGEAFSKLASVFQTQDENQKKLGEAELALKINNAKQQLMKTAVTEQNKINIAKHMADSSMKATLLNAKAQMTVAAKNQKITQSALAVFAVLGGGALYMWWYQMKGKKRK